MPLYEYQCDACAHRFERIQKFSDRRIESCPQCGGQVRKLLSSPAIQFKGSGWYITDYAKKGGGSDKSGDAKPGSTDTKAETKSESASESTSESKKSESSAKTE